MKYYRDLRDFIKVLEEENELVRIKTLVSRDLEISEIYFRQIRSPGGGKALLFENVEGSNLPVLINAFGSKKRMDLALGRRTSREGAPGKVDQIAEELRGLMRLMQFKPPKTAGEIASLAGKAAGILRYPPRRRRFFKAPCQEIVLTGDQIDLDQIP
ncbi:MAG TPA: UbiD family decarboxylase, partial [Leptospiraceae bacterium]|nr:UbiD family decarboxylase [Leptospiraceae bacterium]